MGIEFNVKNKKKTVKDLVSSVFDLNKRKQMLIENLQGLVRLHIEARYSEIKQRSDLSDKEYFETYMKAFNIDEQLFRRELMSSVIAIYNNQSNFQTELQRLQTLFPPPIQADVVLWNKAIEQLLKVAIRVEFVQRNKQVYYQILQQIQNATTESELPDLTNIPFVELPL